MHKFEVRSARLDAQDVNSFPLLDRDHDNPKIWQMAGHHLFQGTRPSPIPQDYQGMNPSSAIRQNCCSSRKHSVSPTNQILVEPQPMAKSAPAESSVTLQYRNKGSGASPPKFVREVNLCGPQGNLWSRFTWLWRRLQAEFPGFTSDITWETQADDQSHADFS